jgi:Flp pilus assembly protein TadG
MAEAGQSMAEFAIILPILLLLTFGTIELGIFLQRQITLTGAGFLAARAATVGGKDGTNPSKAAQEVLKAYGREASQPWVQSVADGSQGKVAVKMDNSNRTVAVTATKRGEAWTGLVAGAAAALGAPLKSDIGQLGGTVVVSREYVKGKGAHDATQERADDTINYQADLGPLNNFNQQMRQYTAPIQQVLKSIPNAPPQINAMIGVLTIDPLQAVAPNPRGQHWSNGRTKGSVYASSDAEDPKFKDAQYFNQPLLLAQNVDASAKSMIALQGQMAANPVMTPAVMTALKTASLIAVQAGQAAVKTLDALDTQIFGAKAGP